jgi:hypothetical protein
VPDHVGSSLLITGSSSEIDRFLATCFSPDPHRPGERYLDFETITPSHPTVLALESLADATLRGGEPLLAAADVDRRVASRSSRFPGTKRLRRMTLDDAQTQRTERCGSSPWRRGPDDSSLPMRHRL